MESSELGAHRDMVTPHCSLSTSCQGYTGPHTLMTLTLLARALTPAQVPGCCRSPRPRSPAAGSAPPAQPCMALGHPQTLDNETHVFIDHLSKCTLSLCAPACSRLGQAQLHTAHDSPKTLIPAVTRAARESYACVQGRTAGPCAEHVDNDIRTLCSGSSRDA